MLQQRSAYACRSSVCMQLQAASRRHGCQAIIWPLLQQRSAEAAFPQQRAAHRKSMIREAMARGSPPTGERVRKESSSSEKEPLHMRANVSGSRCKQWQQRADSE